MKTGVLSFPEIFHNREPGPDGCLCTPASDLSDFIKTNPLKPCVFLSWAALPHSDNGWGQRMHFHICAPCSKPAVRPGAICPQPKLQTEKALCDTIRASGRCGKKRAIKSSLDVCRQSDRHIPRICNDTLPAWLYPFENRSNFKGRRGISAGG